MSGGVWCPPSPVVSIQQVKRDQYSNAVMGPDGMVNIIMRKQLEAIPEGKERDEARIAMAEELRKNIDPYIAAGHAAVDDVIDPADTRHVIWRGLQVSRTKQVQRPWRKHGVLPV